MLLLRLLLLFLLQELRELGLLQRLQVRLSMSLGLGLRSCLWCCLVLPTSIGGLEERGSILSVWILT